MNERQREAFEAGSEAARESAAFLLVEARGFDTLEFWAGAMAFLAGACVAACGQDTAASILIATAGRVAAIPAGHFTPDRLEAANNPEAGDEVAALMHDAGLPASEMPVRLNRRRRLRWPRGWPATLPDNPAGWTRQPLPDQAGEPSAQRFAVVDEHGCELPIRYCHRIDAPERSGFELEGFDCIERGMAWCELQAVWPKWRAKEIATWEVLRR